MNYCDFGERLKQLRKSQGLTQTELGMRVGLSKAVVSKYENGIGFPSFDVLIRISNYFGITTDYLLGVAKRRTLDVSTLSDSQITALQNIISEFNKVKQE